MCPTTTSLGRTSEIDLVSHAGARPDVVGPREGSGWELFPPLCISSGRWPSLSSIEAQVLSYESGSRPRRRTGLSTPRIGRPLFSRFPVSSESGCGYFPTVTVLRMIEHEPKSRPQVAAVYPIGGKVWSTCCTINQILLYSDLAITRIAGSCRDDGGRSSEHPAHNTCRQQFHPARSLLINGEISPCPPRTQTQGLGPSMCVARRDERLD